MGGVESCCNNAQDTSVQEEDFRKHLEDRAEDAECEPADPPAEDAGIEVAPKRAKKQLIIRKTVVTEEIELTQEAVDARKAFGDPDIEALRREGAERAAAARAAANGEGQLDELMPKRTKGRKGTAFAKEKIPIVDEVEDDAVCTQLSDTPPKRTKDRKATTAVVKTELLPIEDDEEE